MKSTHTHTHTSVHCHFHDTPADLLRQQLSSELGCRGRWEAWGAQPVTLAAVPAFLEGLGSGSAAHAPAGQCRDVAVHEPNHV
eukprot:1160760-Pelagomonas_calceolata.AAC.2